MKRSEISALARAIEEGGGDVRALGAQAIAAVVPGVTAMMSPINGRWCLYQGKNRYGDLLGWEPTRGRDLDLWRAYANNRLPTESLDAAVLLLPSMSSFRISSAEIVGGVVGYSAFVCWGAGATFREVTNRGRAATRAIALTAAALRALSLEPDE